MPTQKFDPARIAAGRPARDTVVPRARHLFLQGNRIDMQELAGDLGIGRATLYRWVGDRDQLIADAIWSFAGPFLDEVAEASRAQRGPDRLLAIMHRLGTDLLSLKPYTAFLHREPTAALRILTTPATGIQQRMIDFIGTIIREEIDAGALRLPPHVEADSLAFAVLRLAESFFYADIVAGREADVDEAIAVIGLLLPHTVSSPTESGPARD